MQRRVPRVVGPVRRTRTVLVDPPVEPGQPTDVVPGLVEDVGERMGRMAGRGLLLQRAAGEPLGVGVPALLLADERVQAREPPVVAVPGGDRVQQCPGVLDRLGEPAERDRGDRHGQGQGVERMVGDVPEQGAVTGVAVARDPAYDGLHEAALAGVGAHRCRLDRPPQRGRDVDIEAPLVADERQRGMGQGEAGVGLDGPAERLLGPALQPAYRLERGAPLLPPRRVSWTAAGHTGRAAAVGVSTAGPSRLVARPAACTRISRIAVVSHSVPRRNDPSVQIGARHPPAASRSLPSSAVSMPRPSEPATAVPPRDQGPDQRVGASLRDVARARCS